LRLIIPKICRFSFLEFSRGSSDESFHRISFEESCPVTLIWGSRLTTFLLAHGFVLGQFRADNRYDSEIAPYSLVIYSSLSSLPAYIPQGLNTHSGPLIPIGCSKHFPENLCGWTFINLRGFFSSIARAFQ